jgi:HSP20 family protein
MSTRELTRQTAMPSILEDFFKPWSQWLEDSRLASRAANLPAVNIKEEGTQYIVSLAAPGLKKEDFNIDIENNMLTIRSEKEESNETTDEKYTRKEYNYSSFSRSFSLPEDVKQEAIDARYVNGELTITLPRKEDVKKAAATKRIAVN